MNHARFFLILFATQCLLALSGCSGGGSTEEDVDPDEAFLRDMRQRATTATQSAGETGTLNPGYRNPKIVLETRDFDMGTITYEGLAHAELKVYNRGEGDLRISKITTTCGCTTAKMRSKTISPGGTGILEITVDPTMIAGFSTTKTLALFSNDPARPVVAVDVTTHIAPQVDLLPDEFELGNVAQGVGAEMVTLIRQILPEPLLIDSVVVYEDSPYFSGVYEEVPEKEWQVPGLREYRVTVTLAPEAPPGAYTKVIMIHSNLPHQPLIAVPIEVVVGP